MMDITNTLLDIIQNEQCSPVHALFLLSGEGDKNGICELQSKPKKKIGRGLCNTSNIKSYGDGLGRYIP